MLNFERGVAPEGKSALEREFDRSQALRPILLGSTLLGIAASVSAPFVVSSDALVDLGMSRIGLPGLIVIPLVACMAVGHAIYWLLVRLGRGDARFEA